MIRRLFILNPNATEAMTGDMRDMARSVLPDAVDVVARTNHEGPAAIQGAADAEACLPGLLAMADRAVRDGAEAIVIGCFDDTGLSTIRARMPCPVIGLGEAGILAAGLAGPRYAVVTTTEGSVPVIEDNIRTMGAAARCAGVHAAGIPVLQLAERIVDLRAAVARVAEATGADAIVLGCAGMSPLADELARSSPCRLIDPVRAAASLSLAVSRSLLAGGHPVATITRDAG